MQRYCHMLDLESDLLSKIWRMCEYSKYLKIVSNDYNREMIFPPFGSLLHIDKHDLLKSGVELFVFCRINIFPLAQQKPGWASPFSRI